MSDPPCVRWAVLGVGTAGLARGRAIASDPRSRLAILWRGRHIERFPGARVARSLEEALNHCDAVAVCAPDDQHAGLVEQALSAGRHVVCEYPLAEDERTAAALLDRADEVHKVLHVEHIELLHAPQVALRAHLTRDPAKHLDQRFTRSGAEDEDARSVVRRNLARLHRAIDLCGEVRAIDALTLEPGRVEGSLTHVTGATSHFVWEQSPYLKRQTKQEVETFGGETWTMTRDILRRGRMPQTLIEADGLFAQDHAAAMGRILHGRGPLLSRSRLLHALALREDIASGVIGPLRSH